MALSNKTKTDFITEYMNYVDLENQECPAIYHRWTLVSIAGALLGRQFYLPFGRGIIYPNQYIMLMGEPGTRKGTAMGVGKNLLNGTGFTRFAANRTSQQAFLSEMKYTDEHLDSDSLMELAMDSPAESYVFSGEFVDFIGPSNIDFINLLTNLWDNLPEYKHPKLTSKSVTVIKPTINLFGGSTPQTFSIAFPPEVIGTGFTSRWLLIHAEPTGKRIDWPSEENEVQKEILIAHLSEMKEKIKGEAIFTKEAREATGLIYKNEVTIEDTRFSFYMQRRDTHLKKLSIIIAALNLSMEVRREHVIWANTMLAAAEKRMPNALGEFGKNKYADATNDVLRWLNKQSMPKTANDIFKAVSRNISKLTDLQDILQNLKLTERIQTVNVKGKFGYMTKHRETIVWKDGLIDLDWLTPEERI